VRFRISRNFLEAPGTPTFNLKHFPSVAIYQTDGFEVFFNHSSIKYPSQKLYLSLKTIITQNYRRMIEKDLKPIGYGIRYPVSTLTFIDFELY
jgi:hypothetical protein